MNLRWILTSALLSAELLSPTRDCSCNLSRSACGPRSRVLQHATYRLEWFTGMMGISLKQGVLHTHTHTATRLCCFRTVPSVKRSMCLGFKHQSILCSSVLAQLNFFVFIVHAERLTFTSSACFQPGSCTKCLLSFLNELVALRRGHLRRKQNVSTWNGSNGNLYNEFNVLSNESQTLQRKLWKLTPDRCCGALTRINKRLEL